MHGHAVMPKTFESFEVVLVGNIHTSSYLFPDLLKSSVNHSNHSLPKIFEDPGSLSCVSCQ